MILQLQTQKPVRLTNAKISSPLPPYFINICFDYQQTRPSHKGRPYDVKNDDYLD